MKIAMMASTAGLAGSNEHAIAALHALHALPRSSPVSPVAPLVPAGNRAAAGATPGTAGEHGIAFAWQCLAAVLDPEVPVLSIVELGIVRSVALAADGFAVTITPTYSGCPALEAIVADIQGAFARRGSHATVTTALAPAWSTDWIAPEARNRLRAYGIAPPHAVGARAAASGAAMARIDVAGISPLRRNVQPVACPRCMSTRTELVSQFGSTACKALYRCAACAEPFDYMKPH